MFENCDIRIVKKRNEITAEVSCKINDTAESVYNTIMGDDIHEMFEADCELNDFLMGKELNGIVLSATYYDEFALKQECPENIMLYYEVYDPHSDKFYVIENDEEDVMRRMPDYLCNEFCSRVLTEYNN